MEVAKWLESLEKAVGGGPSGKKRVKTLHVLLIVGGIGAALMLINSFLPYRDVESSAQDPNPPPAEQEAWNQSPAALSPFQQVEHTIETRLEDILGKIVGVGTVDVLVTIDSTEESVLGRHSQESQSTTNEIDKSGGTRHITSITRDGQVVLYEVSGEQKPIITKTINPKIRGILIVAQGAENATVRRLITSAVEKGVNVAVNRIEVVPSKR